MTCPTVRNLLSETVTFTRGAAATHRGIRLAYAFPAAGKPHVPDRVHWWVQEGEDWRLVNIRDLCARAKVRLPLEFTAAYFDTAHRNWLEAAGRTLAMLTHLSPQPTAPAEAHARPWWLFD